VEGADQPDQEDADANVDDFHTQPLRRLGSRGRLLGIMTRSVQDSDGRVAGGTA
jgi:hypothetical protein